MRISLRNCVVVLDRHADLQKQYSEAVHTLKEQKELISQLESDLLSVNALPSTLRGQGEVRSFGPFDFH